MNSHIQSPQQLLGVTCPSQRLVSPQLQGRGFPRGTITLGGGVVLLLCIRRFLNAFVRRVTFRLTAMKLLLRHAQINAIIKPYLDEGVNRDKCREMLTLCM